MLSVFRKDYAGKTLCFPKTSKHWSRRYNKSAIRSSRLLIHRHELRITESPYMVCGYVLLFLLGIKIDNR